MNVQSILSTKGTEVATIEPEASLADATAALREQLRAARGEEQPLFSRGGTIAELKARCEEETHLPAPEAPQFPEAVQG